MCITPALHSPPPVEAAQHTEHQASTAGARAGNAARLTKTHVTRNSGGAVVIKGDTRGTLRQALPPVLSYYDTSLFKQRSDEYDAAQKTETVQVYNRRHYGTVITGTGARTLPGAG